jgi:TonB family protein
MRWTGLLLVGVLQCLVSTSSAAAAESSLGAGEKRVSTQVREPESMLDCAKLTDTKTKLRCFDRVKANAVGAAQSNKPSQRPLDPEPRAERSLEPSSAVAPSVKQPTSIDSAPLTVRSKRKTSTEILSDYAMEVVRQLGKEMHPEEYPARPRQQGIGGTVHSLVRIGTNGRVAGVTVASSSGNTELDQYVIDKLSNLRLPHVPLEFWAREFTVPIPVTFAVRKN